MELYKCLVCNDKVTTSKRTKICIECRRRVYTEKDLTVINDYLRKLQESVSDAPLLPTHKVRKERVGSVTKKDAVAAVSDSVLNINEHDLNFQVSREKIADERVMKRNLEIQNSPLGKFLFQHKSEREFVDNYFDHDQWVHHPATFKLSTCSYTPDFYDKVRGVFIEVTSTKQAYEFNRHKYFMMREEYPSIQFEVRRNTGILVDIEKHINWKAPQITLKELREMAPDTKGLEMIKVNYRFGGSLT